MFEFGSPLVERNPRLRNLIGSVCHTPSLPQQFPTLPSLPLTHTGIQSLDASGAHLQPTVLLDVNKDTEEQVSLDSSEFPDIDNSLLSLPSLLAAQGGSSAFTATLSSRNLAHNLLVQQSSEGELTHRLGGSVPLGLIAQACSSNGDAQQVARLRSLRPLDVSRLQQHRHDGGVSGNHSSESSGSPRAESPRSMVRQQHSNIRGLAMSLLPQQHQQQESAEDDASSQYIGEFGNSPQSSRVVSPRGSAQRGSKSFSSPQQPQYVAQQLLPQTSSKSFSVGPRPSLTLPRPSQDLQRSTPNSLLYQPPWLQHPSNLAPSSNPGPAGSSCSGVNTHAQAMTPASHGSSPSQRSGATSAGGAGAPLIRSTLLSAASLLALSQQLQTGAGPSLYSPTSLYGSASLVSVDGLLTPAAALGPARFSHSLSRTSMTPPAQLPGSTLLEDYLPMIGLAHYAGSLTRRGVPLSEVVGMDDEGMKRMGLVTARARSAVLDSLKQIGIV